MRKVLALLLLPLLGSPALADEEKAAGNDALPGVDTRSIPRTVTEPLPEPDEAVKAGEQPGSFRVGDWEVRIGGEVSYQIGFGDAERR